MKIQKINSISDINLFRLTPKDVGRQYIDNNGKIYKSRINPKTHRIEIVRINRIPVSEIDNYINKIIEEQDLEYTKEVSTNNKESIQDEYNLAGIRNVEQKSQVHTTDKMDNSFIDTTGERITFENFPDVFKKIVSRLKIIEVSILESGIFNSKIASREDLDFMERINKFFAYSIPESLRIVINNYNELKQFPRNIDHYFMRYSNDLISNIKAAADTEEGQLAIIQKYEIYKMFKELVEVISREVKYTFEVLNSVDSSLLQSIHAKQRQHFNDALLTIKTVLSQLNKTLITLNEVKTRYKF